MAQLSQIVGVGSEDADQAGPRPKIQNDVARLERKVPSQENAAEFGSQVFGGHADQTILEEEEMHASAIYHAGLPVVQEGWGVWETYQSGARPSIIPKMYVMRT